jgi:hypothetical protein
MLRVAQAAGASAALKQRDGISTHMRRAECLSACCCPAVTLFLRFKAINGLLLPGGGANLSPGHAFYDAAAALVEMALDANDQGDYFPVSHQPAALPLPVQCLLFLLVSERVHWGVAAAS